jgi:integrase
MFVDISFKIPNRLNVLPGFTNMTNEEIITDHLKEIPNILSSDITYETKSNATIKKEFSTIKKFLSWMKKEEFAHTDLSQFIPSVSVDTTQKEKPMLTNDDYRLYFNSDKYLKGKHKRPSDYWIPLIAIFTGCRVEEIASLFKEDILEDSNLGLYFFHITDDPSINKRRKTSASKRIIPIHNNLIYLGFLDYVESIPPRSSIFPDLKPKKDGRFAIAWNNNFNRHEVEKRNGSIVYNKDGTPRYRRGLLTQCGIEKQFRFLNGQIGSKSFHSFRHYVVNELDRINGQQRYKNFLIGHKHKSGFQPTYIHLQEEDKTEMNKLIQNLEYPMIDFSIIKNFHITKSTKTGITIV